MTTDAEQFAKILWSCRRGMLELDVMLQNFCESYYQKLAPEKQQLFADLLEESDQDLQRWLVKAEVCDKPKFQDMLLVIRHMHIMSKRGQPA